MSFFHKKMSQNLWATIMPFGPVTNILLAQKNFSGQPKAGLISGTENGFLIANITSKVKPEM